MQIVTSAQIFSSPNIGEYSIYIYIYIIQHIHGEYGHHLRCSNRFQPLSFLRIPRNLSRSLEKLDLVHPDPLFIDHWMLNLSVFDSRKVWNMYLNLMYLYIYIVFFSIFFPISQSLGLHRRQKRSCKRCSPGAYLQILALNGLVMVFEEHSARDNLFQHQFFGVWVSVVSHPIL